MPLKKKKTSNLGEKNCAGQVDQNVAVQALEAREGGFESNFPLAVSYLRPRGTCIKKWSYKHQNSKIKVVRANYNDLSRGHLKWWFSKGIPPNPLNSGLGIILICPELWKSKREIGCCWRGHVAHRHWAIACCFARQWIYCPLGEAGKVLEAQVWNILFYQSSSRFLTDLQISSEK